MMKRFLRQSLNRTKYILPFCCSFLVLTMTWLGVFANMNSVANAQSFDRNHNSQIVAFGAREKNQIKENIDEVVGAGTSDKIEGKVEKDLGYTQRNIGKATGQLKGASKEVAGRAKQDIGRTKSAAEDIGSELQEQTENAVDNVRDFFQELMNDEGMGVQ